MSYAQPRLAPFSTCTVWDVLPVANCQKLQVEASQVSDAYLVVLPVFQAGEVGYRRKEK
jgi:hypothetical protein